MKTPAIPNLSPEQLKAVVVFWCFNATLSGTGHLTMKMKDVWNEKISVENLWKLVKVYSWDGEGLSMKLAGVDVPSLSFNGQMSSNRNKALFLEVANITETLQRIELRAGDTQTKVSFTELYECLGELSFVNKILTAEDVELGFECDPASWSDTALSEVLSYFCFQVGDYGYFVLFNAPVTNVSDRADRMKLVFDKRILRDCYVGSDIESIRRAGIQSYEAKSEGREHECLLLGVQVGRRSAQ